jgi:WD40 repeat protein
VALAYDPRGRHLATGGADTLLRLWSPDGKPGRVLSRGDGRPTSLSFGPRGLLAVGFADATARVYDADAGKELRRWRIPGEAVRSIAFAPDGSEVAAGSWVTAVTRWDPRTGKPLGRPPGHVGPVTNLSFRADGHLISVGKDQTVIDWDVLRRTGRAAVVQTGEEFNPTRVLSPDGRRVVVLPGTESSCVVFDTASGKEGCRLRLPPASEHNIVYAAAFSPDGARVAGHAYQGRVHVWDASTGVRQFSSGQVGRPSDREFMGELNLLRYSPDGHRILVRGYERTDGRDLTLLDASNGNSTLSLTGGRSGAWFRPTGRALHLMDPDPREAITRLRIWDGEESRPLWENALLRWWNLTVSPDGRLLATSAPEYRGPITIDIREAATGGLVRQRKGQQSMVTALAFSRDGRTLASGSYDGAILLWDVIGKLPPGTPEDDWWRLADQDAGRAFDAACRLSRPEGVALLARKLRPVLPIEPARWSSLLDRLDSDVFAIRERASKELPTLGLGALALARRSLATEKRREVVRRLQAAIRSWPASPERLRETRALMALEHAGAVGLLKRLAAGADGAELTEEARAALNRLAAR